MSASNRGIPAYAGMTVGGGGNDGKPQPDSHLRGNDGGEAAGMSAIHRGIPAYAGRTVGGRRECRQSTAGFPLTRE